MCRTEKGGREEGRERVKGRNGREKVELFNGRIWGEEKGEGVEHKNRRKTML